MKKVTAVDMEPHRLVIRIPSPRLARLVAKSAILTLAVITFSYLRAVAIAAVHGGAIADAFDAGIDFDLLPSTLYDLEQDGVLKPDHQLAVLVCDQNFQLEYGKFEVVSCEKILEFPDESIDFIFNAGEQCNAVYQKIRTGGVVSFTVGKSPADSLLPTGFRVVYFRRRLGPPVIALKKTNERLAAPGRRRLLSVPQAKKAALDGLEDALLEPPATKTRQQRRTRYLPELTGDSLGAYPRRVFIDVGGRSAGWFEKHYPKRGHEFEVVQLEAAKGSEAAAGGIAEWLQKNVKEEEYVVVKAEAEAAEEIIREKAVVLVDELFLECRHQWQQGRRRGRRAYWECLALYGKLRDQGIAVHQWWG